MTGKTNNSNIRLPGERVLSRIARLTLGFGFAASITAIGLRRREWAEGLAAGAVLGWLNFRWLSRGIRAMMLAVSSQTAAGSGNPQTPAGTSKSTVSALGTYIPLVFRYVLVAFGVYVIFAYLHVPLVSIGLGLCALVAAVISASVWEVLSHEF